MCTIPGCKTSPMPTCEICGERFLHCVEHYRESHRHQLRLAREAQVVDSELLKKMAERHDHHHVQLLQQTLNARKTRIQRLQQ